MKSKLVYKKGKIVTDESWGAKVTAEAERWDMLGMRVPAQEDIDEIVDLLREARSRGELSAMIERIQLPPEIGISELLEDFVLVYWKGDPIARALIAADIETLPVLLADEDINIRELAKQKLDALTKEGGV